MSAPQVDLPLLSRAALEALVAHDLAVASQVAGVALPAWFADNDWLWTLRLGQVVGDPGDAPWLTRAVLDTTTGVAVGLAGFHGPPDERGMVEVGYEIGPEHRRRGYARAALAWLADYGRAHGAAVLRASVAPDNTPSLGLIAQFGLVQVGEQIDERDGRELVFEREL